MKVKVSPGHAKEANILADTWQDKDSRGEWQGRVPPVKRSTGSWEHSKTENEANSHNTRWGEKKTNRHDTYGLRRGKTRWAKESFSSWERKKTNKNTTNTDWEEKKHGKPRKVSRRGKERKLTDTTHTDWEEEKHGEPMIVSPYGKETNLIDTTHTDKERRVKVHQLQSRKENGIH